MMVVLIHVYVSSILPGTTLLSKLTVILSYAFFSYLLNISWPCLAVHSIYILILSGMVGARMWMSIF